MSKVQRIVSLTPSNTEILFALGLGERVVGVTELCNYPPEARQRPKVGDANISVERVVALKPDLVVAHDLLNARVIPVLKRVGLKVLSANPNTFEKLFEFIRAIGRETESLQNAERLTRSLRARIERVRRQAQGLTRRPKVLFVIGLEPLWASGRGTFADEMIEIAGGINALRARVQGFKAVSLETALASNPDLIVLTSGAPETLYQDRRWRSVSAVRRRQVHTVNPDLFLRESPRLVDALEQLAQFIRNTSP